MADFYAKAPGIFSGGGGAGGVVGPASATDNAVARFDGTTGKLIQNSTVIVDDAGNTSGVATLSAVGANLSGLTVSNLVTTDGSKNLVSTAAGNLTAAGTDGISVTNGTGATAGTATSVQQHVSDATHNGYLSSTDWSTFNAKQAALTIGNLTDAGTDGITVTNGTGAVIGTGTSLAQHVSDATHNGYLSSTDWSTFNGKQPAGSYLTAVSVVSANGLAGSSSGTTTPALTLSTTITGILSGDGTAISAASTTGSGAVVLATSPVLVTPALGTPSSGTLTSCTGLPISSGVSGLGTGVATFLGTPSSANLAAAITDETGSGALVFATSPTLVTPVLGTPSSGTLTSCTGLPISSGVSGLGTGVATFLATPSSANLASAITDETGSGALVFATSPSLVTPVLGTPTSGTLTNCTGLPVAGGGTGAASFTAYAVLCGGTTSTGAVQSIAGVGTSGQVLTSNGAGALPTFQAAGGGSVNTVVAAGFSLAAFPFTAGQYGDLTSVSLTAGTWAISANIYSDNTGSTSAVEFDLGVSATSGNSFPDASNGSGINQVVRAPMNNGTGGSNFMILPTTIVAPGVTTVYYLKGIVYTSIANVRAGGRMTAIKLPQ